MRSLPLLALLGSALLLCACGGGGSGSEEAQIRQLIEDSTFSRDPADCRRYSTLNLLEQTHKEKGTAAVRACEETALEPRELPRAVVVTEIEVDGEEATARIANVGGPYSEQEMVVGLVVEDGRWKGNEILEFAVFEREALLLELGREIMGDASTPGHAEAAACVVGVMEGMSDAELEAIALDYSLEDFWERIRPCEPRSASA